MLQIGDKIKSRAWLDAVLLLLNVILLKILVDNWLVLSIVCSLLFLANLFVANLVFSVQSSVDCARLENTNELCRYSEYVPSWYMRLFSYSFNQVVFFILLTAYLVVQTEFTLTKLRLGLDAASVFFADLLKPDWSLFGEAVVVYAKQTVEIALLGTIMAFFTALPISILMSKNTAKIVGVKRLYVPIRAVVSIIRAIPTFLLGLIFVALVGLGPMPGVLAIYIFSIGIMAKQFSESIESLSINPVEAIKSAGGTKAHIMLFGYGTQGIPLIVAHLFYCLEINIHSATVLGLIGAEGIGLPIHEYITAFAYSEASTFILVVILMTVLTDYVSNYVRHKLI